jgi:hypothetical protein
MATIIFDSARVKAAPVSFGIEPWSAADLRRARHFGLNIPAGVVRTPKPARKAPAISKAASPAPTPVNRVAGFLDASRARKTTPARRGPTAEDLAWESGYTAARHDAAPTPPTRLDAACRVAWMLGFEAATRDDRLASGDFAFTGYASEGR